jgi:hypothetical protein
VKTSEMASDMIAFGTDSDTVFPSAREAEVICALPAYVINAQMIIKRLWVRKGSSTVDPLTLMRRGGVGGESVARRARGV